MENIQLLNDEEVKLVIEERYPVKIREMHFGKIPIGYMVNQDNPYQLLPDPEQIKYIEAMFDLNDAGRPLRQLAPWLSENICREVSFQSLSNLYKRHRKPWAPRTKRPKAPFTELPKAVLKKRALKAEISKKLKVLEEMEKKEETKKVEKYNENKDPRFSVLKKVEPKHEIPPSAKIIFKPNKGPQEEFLSASEQEVLYGGAAGGGKSYALLADPIRYFSEPDFRGLLVRRTNDELRELKLKSNELYPKLSQGAIWREKDSTWKFESGATLWLTYLERDEDVYRYQGQAFTWIGFDELTQYSTPFAWNYLRSRLRSTNPRIPLSMRATTNPGGPGHQWVKKMFIDPAPPNKAFWARDLETGETLVYPKGHRWEGKPLFARRFIPARLQDNPYLMEDGAYERNLLSLPEHEQRKLYLGDWTVVEGAAFPEFSPSVHVIEPFDIPKEWRRFRSCDYGYSSHSAVLWFAITPDNELIVYRELYVSKKTAKQLARMVLELERNENISYGIMDSSVWHKRGEGPSIAEEMIAEGCKWRPSDRSAGSRVNGKNRIHHLLQIDKFTEEPRIFFFNTCRQLIADLPSIPSDPGGGEDIDDRFSSDHTYDALRYGVMSRPMASGPFDAWRQSNPVTYTPSDHVFGY